MSILPAHGTEPDPTYAEAARGFRAIADHLEGFLAGLDAVGRTLAAAPPAPRAAKRLAPKVATR